MREILLAAGFAASLPAQAAFEWTAYGGDGRGQRHAPLAQITPANVGRLELAWTFRTGELGEGFARAKDALTFEATPLMVGGTLFFDTATGKLWCGDVGLHLREEIDLIVRGGNYGWDFREGIIPGPSGPPPKAAQLIEPIWDYDHDAGISITGGFVYHGKNLPGLEGKYLFADYGFGKIWALDPDGDKSVTKSHVQQIASAPVIVGFTADPANGDPLLVSYGGQILRLVPNPKKP